MKLSRTVSYAVKAMVALAGEPRESPVCCKNLAESGEMPERFLLQILRTLVTHGLLNSVRGVYGGYCLARAPDEISLLEIIEAIDGPFTLRLPDGTPCDAALERSLGELSDRLREDFSQVKLSNLANQQCQTEPCDEGKEQKREGNSHSQRDRSEMAATH